MYFNKKEAESFLRALDPSAGIWTFQVFDPTGRQEQARVLSGPLKEIGPQLKQYNEQGLDVYVTVNETDGRGRCKGNIRRARAVWQEDDGDGKPLPLMPQLEVQSSEGHAHRYLLVNGDVPLEEAEGFNRRIAQDFGGDPGAVDYSRVLRVPGFYNHKRKCPVRLVAVHSAPPYHFEDLRRALGEPVVKKAKAHGPLPMADGDAPDDWLFQLPGEIARYLTGEEPVQGNEDDHKIVKELYRIHPDAEWVWETLTSNVVRADKAEKYERDDYKQRTLRQAWAEIQAELDVFEVEEPQGEAEPVGRFSLNRAMRRLKAPFWIVQGMWRRGDLIALLGHPNAGKTAIGLDLCLRIALGLELMGRRVVKQRVFYISAENPEEVLLRVKAWCIAHNVSEADLEDTFKICPHRLDLSNPAIAKLIATELKKYEGLEFGVFAVDTFSSNFGGEDENAAAQVMLWINNLRDHIMTILKCSALVMHHPPKGGDPSNWRGSGAVTGALDTIWSAERTENIVTLTQHKRRGPPFEPMHWTTAIVPVSGIVDNFGDTVTTVLALPGVSDEVSQQFDQRYVAILRMIKNDSKATLRQIGDALPRKEDNKPMHPNMVKKVIERMVREGMIKDGGEGGRKILQAGRDYLDYAEAAQTACFEAVTEG